MEQAPISPQTDYMELTADVVSAYVSKNSLPLSELPSILAQVHSSLISLGARQEGAEPGLQKATAAQIKKSVTPDALISFEDGKPYRTLRRHLNNRGLTPEEYRIKWGLAPDYPMTAASYSDRRSALARSLGLGHLRRKQPAKVAVAPEPVAKSAKSRGRPKKTAESAEGAASG
ncbi:MucR family transcriptional regulator [Methylobacterium sp. A54F]